MIQSIRRRPWLAFLSGALLVAGVPIARAGFKYPAGEANPPFNGFPLGDGSDSQANKDKIQPTKDKLGERINEQRVAQGMPPLMGDELAAAAAAKFEAIRANLLKVITLVTSQIKQDFDEEKSKCLKKLFDKGAVCIDFGNGSQGAQFCDTTAECTDDKINISVKKLGCSVLPCHDPSLWDAVTTLYEETSHALQDWTATDANADRQRAKRQQKAACNEKDVDAKQICINQQIVAGLDNISNNMPHGATKPMAKAVLDSVAALPDGPAKTAAIDALKKKAEQEIAFDMDTTTCYQAAKDIIQMFLDGMITKDQMNEQLGKIKWQIAGQTKPIQEPAVETTYEGNSTSGDLRQTQQGSTVQWPTGLSGIYDLELVQGGDVLLISGVHADGLGSILAVRDLEDDGIFHPTELQVAVPATFHLQTSLDLFQPTSGGPVYVYDGLSRLVRSLPDMNGDGIPDLLGPGVNPPMPDLDWVRHFKLTDSGRLLGYETPSGDGNYSPDLSVFELIDDDGDGFYELMTERSTFGDVGFDPSPRGVPIARDTALFVSAMPAADLEVWSLDPLGQRDELLGSGSVPADDHLLLIPLNRRLQANEYLLVDDLTNGRSSNRILVATLPTKALLCLDNGASQASGNWTNSSGSPKVVQADPKSSCDDSFELVVYDPNGVEIPSKTRTITPVSTPGERRVEVGPRESVGVRDPVDGDRMGVTVALLFP